MSGKYDQGGRPVDQENNRNRYLTADSYDTPGLFTPEERLRQLLKEEADTHTNDSQKEVKNEHPD